VVNYDLQTNTNYRDTEIIQNVMLPRPQFWFRLGHAVSSAGHVLKAVWKKKWGTGFGRGLAYPAIPVPVEAGGSDRVRSFS